MDKLFIPYKDALAILAQFKSNFPAVLTNLEHCTGAYLAEDLIADRDFPPFDRVTMDGIAIAHKTYENGQRDFIIETVAPAGIPQCTLKNPRNCIEVMTGAVLPKQTDTVIRYEDVKLDNGKATITVDTIRFRQNIHFTGIDLAQGSCIVKKGQQISSAEINIAAAIGKAALRVLQLPKTVIISTGDELVPVTTTPELHQIRRSNIYGIRNTLKEWGMQADLEHLPDDKHKMMKRIPTLLGHYEVLIFTGGVSKGKFDFLPEVLDALGIEKQFHKIRQRPGKPFWFGTSPTGNIVFALPGNPVSSFVCMCIYIDYWLKKSLGIEQKPLYAVLAEEVAFAPDLVYFLEARLDSRPNGTLSAMPVHGHGSGDFVNLVKADGFLILPENKAIFKKGDVYPFVRFRYDM